MIFFTADTHFDSPLLASVDDKYKPFKKENDRDTASAINEAIISNWNAKVQPSDTVYHVGDFGKAEDARAKNLLAIRQRLNGNIIMVAGNHDHNNIWSIRKKFGGYSELQEVTVEVGGVLQKIVLFHYAMRTWRHSFKGAWHLFGHSHGRMPPYYKSFDVGCMNFNWAPISVPEVAQKMATLDSFPFVETVPDFL